MRVTVIGCSGSFPAPDGPASCYLVEAEGFRMVLDLGSGALGALQRYVDLRELDAVLVSHLHPDHCIDLLALYVARTYDPRRHYATLPVWVPAGGGAHIARAYGKADRQALTEAFDWVEWRDGEHRIGPFTVTVARVAHPVETWAMRVEHAGKVLAYSADTGPCDALVELSRDADIGLFEAAFEVGRDEHGSRDLHLNARDAGEAATKAGVRRLVVTHLPPWNDPEVARRDAAAAFDGPVVLAAPGSTYEL